MTALTPANPLAPFLDMVVATVHGTTTKQRYRTKLAQFFAWWESAGRPLFNRNTVQQYVASIEGPAHQVLHALTPLKKLAKEMHYAGMISAEVLFGIQDITAPKVAGVRQGKRLTEAQVTRLLQTVRNPRDLVAIGLMLHCGLRRAEAAAIEVSQVQVLDGRCLLANVMGKGRKLRSIPLQAWLFDAIFRWLEIGGIKEGPVLGIGVSTLRTISYRYADVAPHSLRRTMGSIMRAKGVELDEIQMLYGHANVATTQSYIGSKLKLIDAGCDRLPEYRMEEI